jgi:DNA-binding transcriptional MocR family regulator
LSLKVVEVPNCSVEGIDVDAVRAVARSTRLGAAVLMPNFNNPSGSLTPDDAKREIVQILTGHEVPIIEDDIYGDLHYGGLRPASLRAFDDSGLVISCGSVSKTIAFGYRIGWAVSPQFHNEISRAKFYTSVACPTLQQLVLARYYASGGYDRYLRRVRSTLAMNSQQYISAIARFFPDGTRVAQPPGGVVLWVELPRNVDGAELFRTAAASSIGVAPGVVFSAKADYRNYLRLSRHGPSCLTARSRPHHLTYSARAADGPTCCALARVGSVAPSGSCTTRTSPRGGACNACTL